MYNVYEEFYKNFNHDLFQLLNLVDSKATDLLSTLKQNGETIIFGGAVREYKNNAYNDYTDLPRDIDIVYKKRNKDLETILRQYDFKKNRFNGYKIKINKIVFDIWNIEDTWAFRENKIICSHEEYTQKLCETVFLNIDAAIYSLNQDKLDALKYFEALNKNELDIVLEENPFVELNLLRALIFQKRYKMSLSTRLKQLFVDFVSNNVDADNILYDIQLEHYNNIKLTKLELKSTLDKFKN